MMPLANRASFIAVACVTAITSWAGQANAQASTSTGLGIADPIYHTARSPSDVDSHWSRGLDDVVGTDDLLEPIGSAVSGHTPATHHHHHSHQGCTCGGCVHETPLTRFRNSAYQGSTFTAGTLGENGESLGFYELTTRFALPIDGMDHVLLFAPSFRHNFFDFAGPVDTPNDLYNVGVSITWMKKISNRLKALAIVTPGVRSDFETSDNAFRLFGLGTVTYQWVPKTLDVTLGAVYLDRDDIPLLPVIGFTWSPTNDWRIDANFPRPRIAKRIDKQGACSESWIYTGAALGGNTWAVERANGQSDKLTITDYQWVFGWEHLRSGGRGLFLETGWAFSRSIEYESDQIERDMDDSIFIRGGITL